MEERINHCTYPPSMNNRPCITYLLGRLSSWNSLHIGQRRCIAKSARSKKILAWLSDPTYVKVTPPKSNHWTRPVIPTDIRSPHYAENGDRSPWKDVISLADTIGPPQWYDRHMAKGMRNACRIAAECLQFAVSLVKPGITTREIDRQVTEWAFAHRCYPSSLNYGGFPGSLCTSVNNVLSHGVPNE